MHEIRRWLKANTCCKVLALTGVFDFEKRHPCFIIKSLLNSLSHPACSIHCICYFTISTCLLDMWWRADTEIATSDFSCQAVDQILTCVHVCACSCVCVGTLVPCVHIPNIAEALEIQDEAGGRDGLLSAGPDSGSCRPVTCTLTHAWTREYPCIGTPECRHTCLLRVCESWWVKHLWRSQLAWRWSLSRYSQQFPLQDGTLNLRSSSQCLWNSQSVLKRHNYRFKAEAWSCRPHTPVSGEMRGENVWTCTECVCVCTCLYADTHVCVSVSRSGRLDYV